MSLIDLLTDTVEIVRNTAGADDAMGNPAESWAVDHLEVARIDRATESDLRDERQDISRSRVVYVGPTADVLGTDRIRWDGQDWFVVHPEPVHGRDSTVHHYRIVIERVA